MAMTFFGLTLSLPLFAASMFLGQGVSPKQQTPMDVAHQFVNVESKLMPNQWNELSDFFAGTPKPNWNRVHIVDVVDIGFDVDPDKADISISTNSLGILDSSLRLTHYPHARLSPGTNSACYGDDYLGFTLRLSQEPGRNANNGAANELGFISVWKIEETSFEPFLTLDAAIRYVERERDKEANLTKVKNASRTLAILSHYKQGKALSGTLSSGAGGGCG